MKDIVQKSGGDAKLRLRGRGSGYVERDTNEESREPLQLCISCTTWEGYETAKKLTEELMTEVYGEYETWCEENGRTDNPPRIYMTEKHHAGEQSLSGRSKRGGNKRGKAKTSITNTVANAGSGSHVNEARSLSRGRPSPGAPEVEEIEKLMQDRNDARRAGDFSQADRIRDDLKNRGIVLSDEKGGHGNASIVTSWRYWRE